MDWLEGRKTLILLSLALKTCKQFEYQLLPDPDGWLTAVVERDGKSFSPLFSPRCVFYAFTEDGDGKFNSSLFL